MAPLDMQAALNSEAEGWNPEPGAQVIGTVLYVSSASSEFGEYPIMELQSEEDGKAVTIHCFHQVLRNAVERWKPEPGDTVGVKYVGFVKAEGGPGDGYENYRMVVDRAAVTA